MNILFQTLLVLFLTQSVHGDDDPFSTCQPFDCGKFKQLSYPFREQSKPEYCGHPEFVLDCPPGNDDDPVLTVKESQKFLVLDHDPQARILKLARSDFSETICPKTFTNTTFDSTPFKYTPKDQLMTLLYDCDEAKVPWSFDCPINGDPRSAYLLPSDPIRKHPWPSCKTRIVVPVLKEKLQSYDVGEILRAGFEVQWTTMDEDKCRDCVDSGGRCGFDSTVKKFTCFCSDHHQAYQSSCVDIHQPSSERPQIVPVASPEGLKSSPMEKKNTGLKIGIGLGAGFGGILLMCFVFFIYLRRRRNQNPPSYYLSRSISSDFSSGKDVEKATTYHGVHLFSYEELVAATNNFDASKELGDGGFGTVYYGELKDGRAVAVKRLYENNYRRVEQFMNEVEILAHLRHVNLVSLYGCTSRHSHELLLVYEYVPNGTVADHLHGERGKPGRLPWAIRLNIAIETANALAFLHASEIIHRDVKTNNILLDKNFTVKVADFGLSRLFPMDVTHVSTAPQGTPGYVDPEYHQCYQLTSKSDVFSFGVVLMELVSSMPAVDITRHRHDINLSTMAINRIQNHALREMVDPNLGFDSDPSVRKMVTAVAELAFQCLQHEKDMRPCMAAVLEELKAIQSRDYGPEKAEKFDTSADDAVLLKSGPLTLSPDSVTINWLSRNTTPNAST